MRNSNQSNALVRAMRAGLILSVVGLCAVGAQESSPRAWYEHQGHEPNPEHPLSHQIFNSPNGSQSRFFEFLYQQNSTLLKGEQSKPVALEEASVGVKSGLVHEAALLSSLVTSIKSNKQDNEELPLLTSSFNADDERHLAATEIIFNKMDDLHGVVSVAEWISAGIIALIQSSVYSDIYTHRYDNYESMKRAFGPQVDNEKCIQQLTGIAERVERLAEQKYSSRDASLHHLLETWGQIANSGLWTGTLFMEGFYNECLRTKYQPHADRVSEKGQMDTRYCVLSLKHKSWQRADKHDIIGINLGICIPKTCDSFNYKNKLDLITKIAQSQSRELEYDEFTVNNFYCLPDEDSPLRSIRNSPKALITAICLGAWVTLLVFATFRYSKLRKAQAARELNLCGSQGDGSASEKNLNCSQATVAGSSGKGSCEAQGDSNQVRMNIYKMLSITNNLRLLFDTSKGSSLLEAPSAKKESTTKSVPPTTTLPSDNVREVPAEKALPASKMNFVDLRCIEGIKVIAMCYVIMGHILMCLPTIMSNGRELASTSSLAFFMANLVPAFAVNAFFTITGILTSYLMFTQNQSQPVIRSPQKWIAFIGFRYLRIMPMYALVVLYCKTLAKYTGSGPLWDYGTSSLAQRHACEHEPWHWTLLFMSNFLPPMQHCIPGGWYLSNDFQFFLVTPFLIVLLERRAKLGLNFLKLLIVLGYLLGFHSIFSSQVSDLRPIAHFSPHGFKLYVSHFSFNYAHPQYRIPAYLIGLIAGYKLFQYEMEKRRFYEEKQRRELEPDNNEEMKQQVEERSPPDWTEGFRRKAQFWALFQMSLCCVMPFIGARITYTKWAGQLMVALITPTSHISFASAIAMFLMLATTGHANKYLTALLSASWWKPLARLSLCAVLVNVEVINFIIQTNTRQHYVSNQYMMMLNLFCIVATYIVATVVCVLFEAPMRAIMNPLMTFAIARLSGKRKQKTN